MSTSMSTSIPFMDIPELQGPIGKYGYYYFYIRPESRGITSIWYKFNSFSRTWQWTPYECLCSKVWMNVNTLTVDNGFWKGKQPAAPNIKIIQYLNEKKPIPQQLSLL